jgi:hypothetical protein
MKKALILMLMILCISIAGNVFADENEYDIDEQDMSDEVEQSFESHLEEAELIYSDNEILDLLSEIESEANISYSLKANELNSLKDSVGGGIQD